MAAKQEPADTVRLRNIKSGAIVSVAADKVDRLGGEWEPADKPASTAKPKPDTKK